MQQLDLEFFLNIPLEVCFSKCSDQEEVVAVDVAAVGYPAEGSLSLHRSYLQSPGHQRTPPCHAAHHHKDCQESSHLTPHQEMDLDIHYPAKKVKLQF